MIKTREANITPMMTPASKGVSRRTMKAAGCVEIELIEMVLDDGNKFALRK